MENGKMSIIIYSNAKKSITCRVYAILLNLPEILKGPLDHKMHWNTISSIVLTRLTIQIVFNDV